jgi:putative DNA primase/helicase
MRQRGMGREAILAALRKENRKCDPPLPDADLRRITGSIGKKAPGRERYHLTDTGNAERFAGQFGESLRHCDDSGQWLHYDGRRWDSRTGQTQARRLAINSARSMLSEAASIDDADRRKALTRWAFQSESATRIQAMLSIAKSLPPITASSRDFDTDAYLLNCLNGTIDLRTGNLRPHEATDRITKISSVEYNADARSQLWADHLLRVMGGDETLIEFLQIAAGYSATGSTSEEVLFSCPRAHRGGQDDDHRSLQSGTRRLRPDHRLRDIPEAQPGRGHPERHRETHRCAARPIGRG